MPPRGAGMSLSKMVAEALQYLGNVRNYAPTTLENYEISFDQFRHFLYAKGLPEDVCQFTGDRHRLPDLQCVHDAVALRVGPLEHHDLEAAEVLGLDRLNNRDVGPGIRLADGRLLEPIRQLLVGQLAPALDVPAEPSELKVKTP